jgi:Recombinase zinc beta ribbon domain
LGEYERNQVQLAGNAYGKVGDTKSGRGGRALLAGLISCARCGRRLSVVYTGRRPRRCYRCDKPNLQLGQRRCLGFGGGRIDDAIAAAMLRAVAPMSIEAAERMLKEEDSDRRRVAEMELQQARYDASLAERRYAACDPDDRLIGAQLERAWEAALQRVEACRSRVESMVLAKSEEPRPPLTELADDLDAAWRSPQTSMKRASDWCAH